MSALAAMERNVIRKAFAVIAALLFLSGPVAAPAFAQSALAPTTNGSVVIVTGNTFQTILAAVSGTLRRSLTIQNNNATDSCWIFIGSGAATKATSIILDTTHGTAYTRYAPYVPSDVIQATCATSSDTLYVDTQ